MMCQSVLLAGDLMLSLEAVALRVRRLMVIKVLAAAFKRRLLLHAPLQCHCRLSLRRQHLPLLHPPLLYLPLQTTSGHDWQLKPQLNKLSTKQLCSQPESLRLKSGVRWPVSRGMCSRRRGRRKRVSLRLTPGPLSSSLSICAHVKN